MFPRLASLFTRLAGFLRTRRGAVLLIFLAVAFVAWVVLQQERREPVYENIPASVWLESVTTNRSRLVEAATAFREMGPAGVEFLGEELNRRPPRVHEWLLQQHQHIPEALKKVVLKPLRQSQSEVILELLNALDTNAAPALPMLLDWVEDKGSALTVYTVASTNGFRLVTNYAGLPGMATTFLRSGTNTPSVVMIPAQSSVTMLTQAVVSAPGLITTNVIIHVKSSSPTISRMTFHVLTNLGSDNPRIIKALLNPVERTAYIIPPAFGTNLKTAVLQSLPLLMQSVESPDSGRLLTALSLLRLASPESPAVHEFMIRKLDTTDIIVFDVAISSLMDTTNDLERIVPPTVRQLAFFRNRPLLLAVPEWRSPAYLALQKFAQHSPLVVPQLQTGLPTAGYREQIQILELLAEAPHTNAVDQALVGSFTNRLEAALRVQAWLTLGEVTGDRQMEVKGLLERLESSPGQNHVLWATYTRLGLLGPEASAAVPHLIQSLKHPDGRFIAKAVETLAQIGPAAKDALPALEALRTHPDLTVRETAAEAIRTISADSTAINAAR